MQSRIAKCKISDKLSLFGSSGKFSPLSALIFFLLFPNQKTTGSISRIGIANTGMENETPRQSVNCCNKGDISASPIPALACMIPEATAALFSPMIGATAPITIPKQSAPVPAGNRMPKKISKLHHPLQKGVTISPTAMKNNSTHHYKKRSIFSVPTYQI